ncbi:MAG: hypothetical protein U0401_20760 [Anaerolineae bacterium]
MKSSKPHPYPQPTGAQNGAARPICQYSLFGQTKRVINPQIETEAAFTGAKQRDSIGCRPAVFCLLFAITKYLYIIFDISGFLIRAFKNYGKN